ncbi:hypothetical protein FW778_17320 [Ginsengibacter hankyongi]|uniref:Uncharacterized protein n=1 Tax=Ginsengibacter hankyongi TaxID=2607284 RepID=A0A5J5IEB1_9BACT|nr:hypothetical protein [Ginsengibacter hankyongi]KAA9037188.1 hypothetical protein FW778_17320 [Ginsengibacter hankyongi]
MYKIVRILLAVFFISFSIQGFSQDTEKSEHPLLDKYYPQAQKPKPDTNKAITNQIQPVYQVKPTPSARNISSPTKKPVLTATIIPADTMSEKPAPATKIVPAVTNTTAITAPVADVSTVSGPSNKPAINKQDTITAKLPVQRIVQPQRAPTQPYMDTRLGSSTPQYDTWKKNNNGAGSVTTSPK